MLSKGKAVRRTLRPVGKDACIVTIPKDSGFIADDIVSFEQPDEYTLVMRKTIVIVKGQEIQNNESKEILVN